MHRGVYLVLNDETDDLAFNSRPEIDVHALVLRLRCFQQIGHLARSDVEAPRIRLGVHHGDLLGTRADSGAEQGADECLAALTEGLVLVVDAGGPASRSWRPVRVPWWRRRRCSDRKFFGWWTCLPPVGCGWSGESSLRVMGSGGADVWCRCASRSGAGVNTRRSRGGWCVHKERPRSPKTPGPVGSVRCGLHHPCGSCESCFSSPCISRRR